jgi:hypothetical protein
MVISFPDRGPAGLLSPPLVVHAEHEEAHDLRRRSDEADADA